MSDAGGLRYRGAGGTGAVDGPHPAQQPQLDATPKKSGAAKKASEEFGINWRALALFIGVPPCCLSGSFCCGRASSPNPSLPRRVWVCAQSLLRSLRLRQLGAHR